MGEHTLRVTGDLPFAQDEGPKAWESEEAPIMV